MNQSHWYYYKQDNIPDDFLQLIQVITQQKNCHYLTQLLWSRGIRDTADLEDLLGSNHYQPTSYSELGKEINLAIERIAKARMTREKVALWGNWQVASIMTTCVLKEGLTQFLWDQHHLTYYFPARHLSYFGLNEQGIDQLIQAGITLVITANTGSYNLEEVNYAQSQGLDIIILDRPVLSCQRPSVVAWVNSHSLPDNHPCYYLSGVAIAYKLLEGLATQYPEYFFQPITNLLDFVALGLLADKVNLRGEGRYLVKEGIKLIKQQKRHNITKLAENGFQIGDRALDIRYGLVNRIKGITSIYNNISFIFNLLTNQNVYHIDRLADQAEKAYFNCLDLAQKMLNEARKKIQNLDLSNTTVITLENNSWQSGLFPFIAENLVQDFGKPLLLITNNLGNEFASCSFAYIYSFPDLDLSLLVNNCRNLLDKFIVEADSIKVILPTENLSLFKDIVAQKIRHQINPLNLTFPRNIDLSLNLNELNYSLYQELKLLEPYNSSDNPSPQILIRNCQLKNIGYVNLKNKNKGKKISYKKTFFQIYDQNSKYSFDGIWWTNYPQEINEQERYDLVGELEYNTDKSSYYFRLLDYKKYLSQNYIYSASQSSTTILDYRYQANNLNLNNSSEHIIKKCPSTWKQVISPYKNAINHQQRLVLAYDHHEIENINNLEKKWLKFIGIIKYLLVDNQVVSIESLSEKINISILSLKKVLSYLYLLNIEYNIQHNCILLQCTNKTFSAKKYTFLHQIFIQIITQENLSKKYFYQVAIDDLEKEISIISKYQ